MYDPMHVIEVESSRERESERGQDELEDRAAERLEKKIRYYIKGDL